MQNRFRTRVKFTRKQFEILEASFNKSQYLKNGRKLEIAEMTGLTENQVVVSKNQVCL